MDIFANYIDFMITIFDNILVLYYDYADADIKVANVIQRVLESGIVFTFAKTW